MMVLFGELGDRRREGVEISFTVQLKKGQGERG